eukprot:29182-Pelagococcus_subviridis.AAC.4
MPARVMRSGARERRRRRRRRDADAGGHGRRHRAPGLAEEPTQRSFRATTQQHATSSRVRARASAPRVRQDRRQVLGGNRHYAK